MSINWTLAAHPSDAVGVERWPCAPNVERTISSAALVQMVDVLHFPIWRQRLAHIWSLQAREGRKRQCSRRPLRRARDRLSAGSTGRINDPKTHRRPEVMCSGLGRRRAVVVGWSWWERRRHDGLREVRHAGRIRSCGRCIHERWPRGAGSALPRRREELSFCQSIVSDSGMGDGKMNEGRPANEDGRSRSNPSPTATSLVHRPPSTSSLSTS